MADAFSHLVSSLGYMRRQEREALFAMFGVDKAMVMATQAISKPALPGLHVASVRMNSAAASTATLSPTSVAQSRSASGTAVASSLMHARPSVVMQPTRSVAMPSGGSKSVRPVDASVHPMLRPSGSVVIPMQRTQPVATPLPTAAQMPQTPNIPLPPTYTLPSNDGGVAGSYAAQPPPTDSGGGGTDASPDTTNTAAVPLATSPSKMKWIFLVGGSLFAAWLFFGRSSTELAHG